MSRIRRLRTFVARYSFTLSRLSYALVAGLVVRRQRQRLWQFAEQMGFTECAPHVPRVRASQLVDERLPVVLMEADQADGNVTVRELIFLAQLVRTQSPRRLFEIGTFDGRTTLAFAANSADDAVVHTLDLPSGSASALTLAPGERVYVDKPTSGARVRGTEFAGKVRQLYGDSATFDFGPYPSELVFVDGSHAYEYVVRDSRSALAMIGRGPGTIVWHDYGTWTDVTRALNDLYEREPAFAALVHVEGTAMAVLRV